MKTKLSEWTRFYIYRCNIVCSTFRRSSPAKETVIFLIFKNSLNPFLQLSVPVRRSCICYSEFNQGLFAKFIGNLLFHIVTLSCNGSEMSTFKIGKQSKLQAWNVLTFELTSAQGTRPKKTNVTSSSDEHKKNLDNNHLPRLKKPVSHEVSSDQSFSPLKGRC